ncbi:MAG TPA: hypothetical protein VGV38_20040 [Pyrinomonadaceae bacterium]|nr:hypothetical protein [Pyrinomonadaceae bacterium]
MFRKTLAVILSAIILSAGLVSADAQTLQDARTDKARAFVARRGTGSDASVVVRFRNDSKLRGYISETGADSFTVVNPKTNTSTVVNYAEVEKVSKPGGFPTKWVVLGASAAAAVILGVTVLHPVLCDGGAGC